MFYLYEMYYTNKQREQAKFILGMACNELRTPSVQVVVSTRPACEHGEG